MENNWPDLSLEEISLGIYDCPHSTPKLSDSGPFMVRTQDIRQGFFDTSSAVCVNEKVYHERTGRVVPQYGDLVFSREGTYFGDAAEVPQGMRLCLGQRMVLIRPNPEYIRASYLRILINSPSFQAVISQYRDGTVAERLNLPVIRNLRVKVPPFDFQDHVIKHLIALERKIELNRQMNATLEAMAQALFKSWFVDFDPVIDNALAAGNPIPETLQSRAKARAALGDQRKPLPEGLKKQFSDRFVFDEDMGWIPDGWKVGTLESVTTELRRGISPKYIDEGGVRVVNQKCIRDHSINFSLTRRNNPKLQKIDGRELSIGDVLVNSTGVGTLGRMAQVKELSETTVVDSHVTVMRPDAASFQPYVFGQAMLCLEASVEAMGEGSTGQTELSRTNLQTLRTVIPPLHCQRHLEKQMLTLAKRQVTATRENSTLTDLRDTLLPKLLSGQLRIPDAEKLAAEVV